MWDQCYIIFEVEGRVAIAVELFQFCDTLMADDQISWRFCGYVTPAGGCDVQEWFDALLEVERDEATDVLAYLQHLPRHLWRLPDFESFDTDISEIRFKVGSLKKIYRIYGTFWPERERCSYTFLIGKNKKVNNDRRVNMKLKGV